MKLMGLIGASLAAALLVAFPANAAVSPGFDTQAAFLSSADHGADCVTALAGDGAIAFTVADEACDLTMAEATGLCLVTAVNLPGAPISAVLAPNEGIFCTTSRPGPPG